VLDTDTKRRIDTGRDILVGKVPDPKSQVEQITIALIYKFMDDTTVSAWNQRYASNMGLSSLW
jgi:type I restriction enzyme M protein